MAPETGRFRLAAPIRPGPDRPGPDGVLLLRARRPDRRGDRRARRRDAAARRRAKSWWRAAPASTTRWPAPAREIPSRSPTRAPTPPSRTSPAPLPTVTPHGDAAGDHQAGVTAAGDDPAVPLTVRARPGERPLIRFPEHGRPGERPQWVFHGGEGARLVLDGLFVSGGDIVLPGPVRARQDRRLHLRPRHARARRHRPATRTRPRAGGGARRPRTSREPVLTVGQSVDGRALLPTRLWIEPAPHRPGQPPGQWPSPPDAVRCLEIDRSILGPIRTRSGGLAERVVVTDSILQGFRTSAEATCTAADVFDPVLLYDQLSPGRATGGTAPRAAQPVVRAHLAVSGQRHPAGGPQAAARHPGTARERTAGAGAGAERGHRPRRLPPRPLGRGAAQPAGAGPARPGGRAARLAQPAAARRRLPAGARPGGLRGRRGDRAPEPGHRARPGDRPAGCTRPTASCTASPSPTTGKTAASATARRRRAAGCRAQFNSALAERRRGAVHQHRLRASRLRAAPRHRRPGDRRPARRAASLLAGSSTGAQLGAFPAQAGPARERALRVKYNEYLPLGLVPAIVHVT